VIDRAVDGIMGGGFFIVDVLPKQILFSKADPYIRL